MFIQVIEGTTSDPEGLRRQDERWQQELRPGAEGFLGRTGGVGADGRVILIARFEDEAAAKANSERPEQGAWWAETAKYFDAEPTFRDCSDVEIFQDGGSDDAGFVQVMQGTVSDRARLAAIEAKLMPKMVELRPDVIGSVRAWDGSHYTEAIYFRSEAEARKGEASMSGDLGDEAMTEYLSLVDGVTYLDLTDPWLRTS